MRKLPIIILSDRSNDPDVAAVTVIEGHIVGTRHLNLQLFRDVGALELVLRNGARVQLVQTAALNPIFEYMQTIAQIDVAPYVQFKFVGRERSVPDGRFEILQVAWRFEHALFEKRSKFTPPSPVPFTGPVTR